VDVPGASCAGLGKTMAKPKRMKAVGLSFVFPLALPSGARCSGYVNGNGLHDADGVEPVPPARRGRNGLEGHPLERMSRHSSIELLEACRKREWDCCRFVSLAKPLTFPNSALAANVRIQSVFRRKSQGTGRPFVGLTKESGSGVQPANEAKGKRAQAEECPWVPVPQCCP